MILGALQQPLFDGETAVRAFLAADAKGYSTLSVYQTGLGTITGGTILIEEAPTKAYAGTWSLVLTLDATLVTGGATQATALPIGAYAWVRGRISNTITGGGIMSVFLVGA